jgi:hypothetical protein
LVDRKDTSVTAEVERRLEHFFGEGDQAEVSMEDRGDMEESPLRDLKALVLSIDWEITDETMSRFLRQIERLEDLYRDDKDLLLFVQLLGSLGKYIKANAAKAHPNSIRVMQSVYNALEKVTLSEGMPQAEKEKILLLEVVRFKELKRQIALRKAEKEREATAKTPEKTKAAIQGRQEEVSVEGVTPEEVPKEASGPEWNHMTSHEAFAYALEEIKQVIKAEFQALRAELKLWREAE